MTGRELAALCGQDSIVAIRRPFYHWLGSVSDALLIDHMLYMQHRAGDQPWSETDSDMAEALCLTTHAVEKSRARLVGLGLVTMKRRGMPARMTYLVNTDAAFAQFGAWVARVSVAAPGVPSQAPEPEAEPPAAPTVSTESAGVHGVAEDVAASVPNTVNLNADSGVPVSLIGHTSVADSAHMCAQSGEHSSIGGVKGGRPVKATPRAVARGGASEPEAQAAPPSGGTATQAEKAPGPASDRPDPSLVDELTVYDFGAPAAGSIEGLAVALAQAKPRAGSMAAGLLELVKGGGSTADPAPAAPAPPRVRPVRRQPAVASPRTGLFEAIAHAARLSTKTMSEIDRVNVGKLTRDLRSSGMTPEAVTQGAMVWQREMGQRRPGRKVAPPSIAQLRSHLAGWWEDRERTRYRRELVTYHADWVAVVWDRFHAGDETALADVALAPWGVLRAIRERQVSRGAVLEQPVTWPAALREAYLDLHEEWGGRAVAGWPPVEWVRRDHERAVAPEELSA